MLSLLLCRRRTKLIKDGCDSSWGNSITPNVDDPVNRTITLYHSLATANTPNAKWKILTHVGDPVHHIKSPPMRKSSQQINTKIPSSKLEIFSSTQQWGPWLVVAYLLPITSTKLFWGTVLTSHFALTSHFHFYWMYTTGLIKDGCDSSCVRCYNIPHWRPCR